MGMPIPSLYHLNSPPFPRPSHSRFLRKSWKWGFCGHLLEDTKQLGDPPCLVWTFSVSSWVGRREESRWGWGTGQLCEQEKGKYPLLRVELAFSKKTKEKRLSAIAW